MIFICIANDHFEFHQRFDYHFNKQQSKEKDENITALRKSLESLNTVSEAL